MMIDNVSKKIEVLIEEGNSFNPYNLTTYHSTADYKKWKAKVAHFLISKFGLFSSVYGTFKEGEEILDIEKDFEKGHEYIMYSLQTAYKLCKHPKKENISIGKELSHENTEIKKEEMIPIKNKIGTETIIEINGSRPYAANIQ